MIIFSLRILFGYLTLQIPAISHERFINICSTRMIRLWNIKQKEDICSFNILLRDYKKLEPIIKKTNINVIEKHKRGIPFIYQKYNNHNSFILGVVIYCIILYMLTLFTWDITVQGTYTYTEKEIVDCLEEANITHGILIGNIACEELERYIRNKYFDITWVSAEIRGTRLIVHIKENDDTFVKDEEKEPRNIVANCSGVITHMITRSGTPFAAIGETISKGDLLVSAQVDIWGDFEELIRSEYVWADADIIGETYYEYYDKIDRKYVKKVYTGNEKKMYRVITDNSAYKFKIGNVNFSKYDTFTEYSSLKFGHNFALPVQIATIVYREYEEIDSEYTDEELQFIAEQNLSNYLQKLIEKGIQIDGKNVKIDIIKEFCVAHGNITVTQSFNEYDKPVIIENDEKMSEGTDIADEHN